MYLVELPRHTNELQQEIIDDLIHNGVSHTRVITILKIKESQYW